MKFVKRKFKFEPARSEADMKRIVKSLEDRRQNAEIKRIKGDLKEAQQDAKELKKEQRQLAKEQRLARTYLDTDMMDITNTDPKIYDKLLYLSKNHPKEFRELMNTKMLSGMQKQLNHYNNKVSNIGAMPELIAGNEEAVEGWVDEVNKHIRHLKQSGTPMNQIIQSLPPLMRAMPQLVKGSRGHKKFNQKMDRIGLDIHLTSNQFEIVKKYVIPNNPSPASAPPPAPLRSSPVRSSPVRSSLRDPTSTPVHSSLPSPIVKQVEQHAEKVVKDILAENAVEGRTKQRQKLESVASANNIEIEYKGKKSVEQAATAVRFGLQEKMKSGLHDLLTDGDLSPGIITPSKLMQVLKVPEKPSKLPQEIPIDVLNSMIEVHQSPYLSVLPPSSGHGLKGGKLISTGVKELKNRLKILIGEINAGNRSAPELKAEISEIIDFLYAKKKISSEAHKSIVNLLGLKYFMNV